SSGSVSRYSATPLRPSMPHRYSAVLSAMASNSMPGMGNAVLPLPTAPKPAPHQAEAWLVTVSMKFGQPFARRSANEASRPLVTAAMVSMRNSRLAIGSAAPPSTATKNAVALAKRYAAKASMSRVTTYAAMVDLLVVSTMPASDTP